MLKRTLILSLATEAGTAAAFVEYDALTPETASATPANHVPDYAEEAAIEIVRARLSPNTRSADLRGTKIVRAATRAWGEAFSENWPAADVAALASRVAS